MRALASLLQTPILLCPLPSVAIFNIHLPQILIKIFHLNLGLPIILLPSGLLSYFLNYTLISDS